MATTGSEILARALKRQGTEVLFYLMGGPMLAAESACIAEGIRMIDVRHEQAAAMMAHAYSRVLNRPGVCMAASGPGTTNLVTGVANAFVDSAPVVAIGGSSPVSQLGKGAFQEMDQIAMMRPIVRWAERVYDPRRIPELVATAFRHACGGRPGPVYLDLPGDVLYHRVEDAEVAWAEPFDPRTRARPAGDPDLVRRTVDLLARAERPVLISGSGILWSDAAEELQALVDETGIPFYTTPQGRGVVAEDHALCFSHARSTAFREADVIIAVGTRLNYVIGYAQPPRFAAGAKLVQIDLDPAEIGRNRAADIGIVGDAKAVLRQLVEAADGRVEAKRYAEWLAHLGSVNRGKRADSEAAMSTDQVPIHPLRLCKEVRDFLDRDAILVVDGQEILNYGRQAIPTYAAGHRLNSGPFGTMGVGLPYGLGAKAAKPETQVLVLHGDGSFGLNAMELDTAARHQLPVITVISLNGGWTADPERNKPGRDLGYTRFDRMAEALGCYGEHVETPDGIRPALERAAEAGVPAVVNVVTDWRARATTVQFADYST
ncbi:MAG: thiamine pyrophosphate-binding protein [Bacillati bacterium ANGP1]|uniref:Thiamine pyrophosphate-binding protein n=1 Tax=Candidatus Segetimicrobium genomatis TaxID=2569760 RepID=A0A537JY60_9BACT|nr:MAG: thiamine pyrophosphate-binding protein [Terrabacteria group bacterium ANGP1]